MSLQTPLYEDHVKRGAKMVNFAGWMMPVQYSGLRQEHECVRAHVGLFDVSHMGEFMVTGPGSLETLEWVTTNSVSKLEEGQAQYTLMMTDGGGVVDDLIVYCLEKGNKYLLCVNASNIEKDFQWLEKNNKGQAQLENQSRDWGQIAVQGPKSPELIQDVLGVSIADKKPFTWEYCDYKGTTAIVARTGYTGEMGVEVYLPKEAALSFWEESLEKGQAYQVQPIGLGARDTLRLEKAYCLYGHELTAETSPAEARLGWVVKAKAKDFIGKTAYLEKKESGVQKKLMGFRLLDKGIARDGFELKDLETGESLGHVTSGTLSPSLGEAIGLAYVKTSHAVEGKAIGVQIRQRLGRAEIVKTPFL